MSDTEHTEATAEYIQQTYETMLEAITRDGVNDPLYDEYMIMEFLVLVMKSPRLSENAKRPIMRGILYAWSDAGSEVELEEEEEEEGKSDGSAYGIRG